MTLLASATELADFLELDAPVGDEVRRAELLLAGVSGMVLGHLQRPSLEAVEAVGLIDGSGTPVMLLPADHIIDVISIVEDPRGAATDLAVDTAFDWNRDGILHRVDGGVWLRRSRWYEVTISYGLSANEIEAVKLVVLRVAARALVNPEGLSQESMGGYSAGFAFDESRLPTLAAPDRRELDLYRVSMAAPGIFEAVGS